MNFNDSGQHWTHEITLDEIRAVIGLLIYGRVFGSSHEDLESLYKMDGTGRLIFPAGMKKNRFRFLLSMMRFDDKTTRAERRLNDIWDILLKLVI